MRVLSFIPLPAAVGAMVLLPAGLLIGAVPRTQAHSNPCGARIGAAVVACPDSEPQEAAGERAFLAGDAPAFLFASVQPIKAPEAYLRHEMLHHILQTAGWQPRALQPGEHHIIADLHPTPLFGLCTGGQ